MTKDEKLHLSHVADLGCIACRKMGFIGTPAEIHHIRDGVGIGRRASNFETIPLCPFIIGLVDMVRRSMQAAKLLSLDLEQRGNYLKRLCR